MLWREFAQAAEETGAESTAWRRQQQQQQRRTLPHVVFPCVLLSHQESCLSDSAPYGCQGRLKFSYHAVFSSQKMILDGVIHINVFLCQLYVEMSKWRESTEFLGGTFLPAVFELGRFLRICDISVYVPANLWLDLMSWVPAFVREDLCASFSLPDI